MITAVFSRFLVGTAEKPSRLAQIATRIADALIASRARSAAQELRRHEAFMQDLSRRQDHSALFLDQVDLLPTKI
jgi:microcystin degradation protein MlrC